MTFLKFKWQSKWKSQIRTWIFSGLYASLLFPPWYAGWLENVTIWGAWDWKCSSDEGEALKPKKRVVMVWGWEAGRLGSRSGKTKFLYTPFSYCGNLLPIWKTVLSRVQFKYVLVTNHMHSVGLWGCKDVWPGTHPRAAHIYSGKRTHEEPTRNR